MAKILPHGFQKLLGLVFVLQSERSIICKGKFNFDHFKQWISTINPVVANQLQYSYFKDFKQISRDVYQVGQDEYINPIAKFEIKASGLGICKEARSNRLPVD
ncbi:MAG: hypothetical protein ACK4M7_02035 [Burkholderiales bacterium]